MKADQKNGPIGVFDSGYGGLTILREMTRRLPQYDYLYLGDNARAPYGTRSFEAVYNFTLEAVKCLFDAGCPLVILACNTASAKALRTIQQRDLPHIDPSRRVLGVIRPTVEALGQLSHTGHVGVLGTSGTIRSGSYCAETAKLFPDFKVSGHACPMWVPLVENGEAAGDGADYFVKKDIDTLLARDKQIDTIILGCTHYPLLSDKIRQYTPDNIALIQQGDIVAESLADYLVRHPEMERRITRNGRVNYLTTDDPERFSALGAHFMGAPVDATRVSLHSDAHKSSVPDWQAEIDRYYAAGSELRDIYMRHCRSVADLALDILYTRRLPLDPALVEAAAMLHDIGIVATDAAGIHCHGTEPYLRHGVIGAEMLRSDGMPDAIADVAERHTGCGITVDDIDTMNLPLPRRDLMPRNLLERLICYADKFYSKSGDMKRKSRERVIASMLRHSEATRDRFLALEAEFGPVSTNNSPSA